MTSLDDIAQVAGYRATRLIAAWYSGRPFEVPRVPRVDHPLASLIGLPALRALVREYAGERFHIPVWSDEERLLRERVVAERLAAGQDTDTVAVALGITRRRVEQIRADLIDRGCLRVVARRRRMLQVDAPLLAEAPEVSGADASTG